MYMDIEIGKCGLACEICKNYNNGCLGCIKENNDKQLCVIYKCANKKDIQYCLQCEEFPCKLILGISKSYCPIFSRIQLGM